MVLERLTNEISRRKPGYRRQETGDRIQKELLLQLVVACFLLKFDKGEKFVILA